MQKHDLIRLNKTILRILAVHENKVLVMDCLKRNMPQWVDIASIAGSESCTELELSEEANMELVELELLDPATRKTVHERFTIIAGILPFVTDDKMRSVLIARIAEEHDICKQTVRNYLCLYLAFQNLSALAPKQRSEDKPLSKDEKNMRWALNKFFYMKNQNSLTTAYTLMLKERYTDSSGSLLPEYPTFNQFRYFYRKHRKMQTYLISRNGLKDYQRNSRPLLGNGVQSFAPAIGVAMLDSTICDIYLVDEAGNLVGRPILTACVDAFSGLCCGYSLSWEGGVYSLRGLMECVIADKVELCRKHGIAIKSGDWNCKQLPATLVTDMGSEYKSANFEQIAELGVKVVNLPAYRPELKGSVEKFFDLIQSLYKPTLKGKGIIEPDYQERSAHDYRKDACITLDSFETILLHCILYYNCQRIIENFPYTEEMLSANISPHASDIWNWGMRQPGANLITVSADELLMALMPRTTGTFTRLGLKVNQLRYARDGYTEAYLSGGSVTVAYNPDDVSCVWLLDKGSYIPFYLIETRFNGMSLEAVEAMLSQIDALNVPVDIVLNNAGLQIAYRNEYLTTPKEDYLVSFNVNTIAPMMICYHFLPKMQERGFGRILNTTSGISLDPQQAGYSASKAALDKVTIDLGMKYEDSNVLINLTDPGWCRTDLGGQHAPNAPESAIPGIVVGAFVDDKKSGRYLNAPHFTGMTLEDAVKKAEAEFDSPY